MAACNHTCITDAGYVCDVVLEVCASVCGDSYQVLDEGCDDGNTVGRDGCSSTCGVEPGYTCPSGGGPCALIADGSGTGSAPSFEFNPLDPSHWGFWATWGFFLVCTALLICVVCKRVRDGRKSSSAVSRYRGNARRALSRESSDVGRKQSRGTLRRHDSALSGSSRGSRGSRGRRASVGSSDRSMDSRSMSMTKMTPTRRGRRRSNTEGGESTSDRSSGRRALKKRKSSSALLEFSDSTLMREGSETSLNTMGKFQKNLGKLSTKAQPSYANRSAMSFSPPPLGKAQSSGDFAKMAAFTTAKRRLDFDESNGGGFGGSTSAGNSPSPARKAALKKVALLKRGAVARQRSSSSIVSKEERERILARSIPSPMRARIGSFGADAGDRSYSRLSQSLSRGISQTP